MTVAGHGAGAITDLFSVSRVVSLVVGVLVCTGVFVLLVRWFALERIRYPLLAAGGLVFGLLWLLARLLFTVYLNTIAPYGWVYGSFATVVVVLLWAYYSMIIFLFSAE